MRTVVIESPYAGNVELNVRYAKACVRDCLKRGEAPYASHLFFTQEGLLDDTIPEQRTLGIAAGFAIAEQCDARVVYDDIDQSGGMTQGIQHAQTIGQLVEFRTLGPDWDSE
jgi:hypothetical protein